MKGGRQGSNGKERRGGDGVGREAEHKNGAVLTRFFFGLLLFVGNIANMAEGSTSVNYASCNFG
jgi:hypothetical protein